MLIRFSKDELTRHFPEIDSERIDKVWYALRIINDLNSNNWDRWVETEVPHYPLYNKSNSRRLEAVMYYCDRALQTHGVENIKTKDGRLRNFYWMDTRALYLNSGDVDSPTLVADLEESEFRLTTFGDFVDELEVISNENA